MIHPSIDWVGLFGSLVGLRWAIGLGVKGLVSRYYWDTSNKTPLPYKEHSEKVISVQSKHIIHAIFRKYYDFVVGIRSLPYGPPHPQIFLSQPTFNWTATSRDSGQWNVIEIQRWKHRVSLVK